MLLSTGILLATLCTAATSQSQGKVWVVDASGGGDFTTVQAAVDAAFQGNSILVRAGYYDEYVTVENKALQIVGDFQQRPRIRTMRLLGHAPTREVYIAELRFDNLRVGWGSEPVTSDLLVEGCELQPPLEYQQDAVAVVGAGTTSATFVSCDSRGGTECNWTMCGPDRGGAGFLVLASRAFFYFNSGTGGRGGTYADGFCSSGIDNGGGFGLFVDAPNVYSSHNQFVGNWGGGGASDPELCECYGTCIDNYFTTGVYVEYPQTLVEDTTPLTRLRIPNLLRENDAFEVRLVGTPGAEVYLLESANADVLPLGPDVGVLHLDLDYASAERHIGTIPAGGSLSVPVIAPLLTGAAESQMLYYQAFIDDGVSTYLSNPTGSLLIDESF